MACRGLWECLLKLLNFLLTLTGLAMVGYGVYLLVEWNKVSSSDDDDEPISPTGDNSEFLTFGRPMLVAVSLSSSFLDKLPKAWFIYLIIGIGVVLFIISCFGFIGAVSRNGCCLSYYTANYNVITYIQMVCSVAYAQDCLSDGYSFLVILLILVELGAAAFIFFDHSWKHIIPVDRTGNFDVIYDFLEENWKIAKWVALGAVILEALVFLLALIVRAANRPVEYDSDDEYIAQSSGIRQPLINQQGAPATGMPASGTLDQRPSRHDAWSQRMREKYGLDTSKFTYNSSDPNRSQQSATPSSEERGGCNIL